MTDKEIDLIRRLKTGDESALEEIIKVFNQYVASIVSKILYGYTDGIDIQGIINHVFFQLWQNSDKLDTSRGSGLKSYLGTIARNAAINEKRKIRQLYPLEEHIIGEVHDAYDQVELRKILSDALKKLTPEEQLILIAFYFQGKSIKTIAAEQQKKESTVKSTLKRSRDKFRNILVKGGFVYET